MAHTKHRETRRYSLMTFEEWYEDNFDVDHRVVSVTATYKAMKRAYEAGFYAGYEHEAYNSGWKDGYREGYYDASDEAIKGKGSGL